MSRKILAAWVGTILAGSTLANQNVWAEINGFEAYRQGNYPLASQLLLNQTAKNPLADYYLGKMRLYGYGELRNDTLAFRYFEQAAEKGVVESQLLLARYYLIEKHQPEKALQWFKKAAAKGSVDAQLYCAAAYLYGFGTKKQADNGWTYLLNAAKSGNATGQCVLAEHFFAQRSVKSKKWGLGWINKSVQQNNPRAQYKLAELYETGTLVKKDPIKMYDLLKQSAKQSYVPAMIKLGEIALKQNQIESAQYWFSQAVSTNHNEQAQYLLGMIYLDNGNKYFNVEEGVKLITQAAEKGLTKAQEKLAVMYQNGQNVPLNTVLAEQWQKKSKEANPISPKIAVSRWLSEDKSDNFNFEGFALEGIYNAWKNTNALKENNYNTFPQMGAIKRSEIYQPHFKMIEPSEIAIADYLDKINFSKENKQAFKIADLKKLYRYPLDPQIEAIKKQDSLVLQPSDSSGSKGSNVTDGSNVSHVNNGSNLGKVENITSDDLEKKNKDSEYSQQDKQDQSAESAKNQAQYQHALADLYNRAILGETNSQFEIGQLYHYGVAVSKNIPQALTYYRLAALQQDLRAEYNLGLTYLEGLTEPVDYNTGMTWLNSAAFKGNKYAQYALALIYENGLQDNDGNLVIQADPEQSATLFYLAAANHYGPAQYRLANYLSKQTNTDLSVSAKEKKVELIRGLYANAVKEGVSEANLPLAFYDAMDKNPERQRLALSIAEQEAKRGNTQGALLMGIMVERGLGVAANQLEALHWYQQASINPVSAFILGTYYSQGKGLAKDIEKGKTLLSQAANSGFSYANLNLSVLKNMQGEEFIPELEKALQLGNSTAGLLLADYYLAQSNDPKKIQQAQEIYNHFADKGDRNAQLKLGYLFDKGIGGVQNSDLAAKWYVAAAEQGLPFAQYSLGQYYQLGKIGGKPNYGEAKKWYIASASRDSRAANALGFIYDTVDYDYSKAFNSYQIASKSNDCLGLFNLGLIHEYGKGMPVDYEKARLLYTQAAEQGHAKSMNQLANLYFHGLGGTRDEKQALKLYNKAAELGDTDSLYQLGLFSETGITDFNLPKALGYYEQASAKGNNEKAKLALARMYQYGIGVSADVKKAQHYYGELAENNNAYAQYQLAMMNLDDATSSNHKVEAKRLLQKADVNGSLQARRVLKWLEVQQQERLSFIEPIQMNQASAVVADQSAELMYLYAISEWNRGDEALSRQILDRTVSQFPKYVPAKKVYEQLTQPKISSVVNVTKQEK